MIRPIEFAHICDLHAQVGAAVVLAVADQSADDKHDPPKRGIESRDGHILPGFRVPGGCDAEPAPVVIAQHIGLFRPFIPTHAEGAGRSG